MDIAKAVIALVDALGLKQVDLVGHSFGANVVGAVAAAIPKTVSSVTVIAPPAFGARVNQDYVTGFLGAQRKKEMKPVLEMLFSSPELVGRTMVNDAIAGLRDEETRTALGKIAEKLLAIPQTSLDKDLAFLRRWPAKILWGDQDRVVPMPAGLADAADGILAVMPGVGHMPQAERPLEVAALVVGSSRL